MCEPGGLCTVRTSQTYEDTDCLTSLNTRYSEYRNSQRRIRGYHRLRVQGQVSQGTGEGLLGGVRHKATFRNYRNTCAPGDSPDAEELASIMIKMTTFKMFILIVYAWAFSLHVYLCVTCTVLTEARGGYRNLWDWSYRSCELPCWR